MFYSAGFHATNPILVTGNVYNGAFPQIFSGSTFTFTDSGDNASNLLYAFDMVR